MKSAGFQTILSFLLLVFAFGCGNKPSATEASGETKNSDRSVSILIPERAEAANANTNSQGSADSRTTSQTTITVPSTALSVPVAATPTIKRAAGNEVTVLENGQARLVPRVPPPAELVARAQGGDAAAQRDLAKHYSDTGDKKESSRWYQEAADKGDAEAQRMLGLAYLFGEGVDRNMEQAGKYFLLSAEQGDAIAQRELGKIYGEQWKYAESNEWYQKAALQGDLESMRMLGLRFTIGQGIEPNREEAVKWFTMAAEGGDAVSQRELGKYYGEKWNLKESNYWYLKAAEQGDIRAQHMMGVRYTFGQGVERNVEEAGQWFLKAAEQGDAQSQFSIGLRWTRGEAGEPPDFTEAAKWFRLAAEQGLDDAQLSLARRYAGGEGIEQDYVEAYKWTFLAKQQGKVQGANAFLNEIAAKMSAEQIEQAKTAANAFKPGKPAPLQTQPTQSWAPAQ